MKKERAVFLAAAAALLISLTAATLGLTGKFDRQQEQERAAGQGAVTIHTLDGNAWGYFGEVYITVDKYGNTDVVLENAWLVDTTDKTFLNPCGQEEDSPERKPE